MNVLPYLADVAVVHGTAHVAAAAGDVDAAAGAVDVAAPGAAAVVVEEAVDMHADQSWDGQV